MLKVDISCLNALSNEVIVHFDMLCMRVEHQVSSQIDTAHVVTEKGSQIHDGKSHILMYPLEPLCSHRGAPVFDLCARKSDGSLLLSTPRYGSTTKGENKSGG